MKITIDTKEITNTIRGNVQTFRSKIENNIPTIEKEDAYEKLQDELDYVKMVLEWNKRRISDGKNPFFPKKLSKTAQRILKDGLIKISTKDKEE